MSNTLEKSFDLGLGLLLYYRDKVGEFVEELVNKGDVAKKDARKCASELVQRGEEQREELKKLIQSEISKALEQAGVARKEDHATKDEIRKIVREELREALRNQGAPDEGDPN